MALIVHPRDHDLVIGTHGRAAYILDDVRPLRALADQPSITAKPLHLFEIPPTIQYQVNQVAGMRFVADAKFTGPNRPYGALLSYFVKDGSDTAKVTIEVAGTDGKIRSFQGPAKAGINRTAWDLRYDGPRNVRGDTPAEFLPPGPPVLPGSYSIKIKLGSNEASGTVKVDADPRFQITDADRRAKHDMLQLLKQRQNVVVEAIDRINAAEKAVDRVTEQLKGKTDAESKALGQTAEELKKKVKALKESLSGPQDIQGFTDGPDAVISRVGEVYGSLASSWDAPTESQRTAWRQAEPILQTGLDAVNRFLNQDLAPFRQRATAALLEVFPAVDPLSLDWVKRP